MKFMFIIIINNNIIAQRTLKPNTILYYDIENILAGIN